MKSLLFTTAFLAAPMVSTVSAQTSTAALKRQIAEQSRQIVSLEKEVSSLQSQLNLERVRNGKTALPVKKASNSQSHTGATKTYVVKSGDNFSKIARKHGISLAALIKANKGVSPSKISIGQKINLPVVGPQPTVTKPTPSTPKPISARGSSKGSYTVAKGDTLYGIAKKNKISLKQLLAANPTLNPKKLKIGQVINISGAPVVNTAKKPAHRPKPINKKPTPPKATPKAKPVAKPSEPLPKPIEKHIEQDAQIARTVKVSKVMTYAQFAAQNGTTVSMLNRLNGLDLPADEPLAVGSELFVPNKL